MSGMIFAVGATRWTSPATIVPWPNAASGPASLTYDPNVPPPGTRCLVLFAGHGIADPWVVAFDRWPS